MGTEPQNSEEKDKVMLVGLWKQKNWEEECLIGGHVAKKEK